ncbi:hypothetical protein MHYP_G00250560 [Metynnis hypsauchen]
MEAELFLLSLLFLPFVHGWNNNGAVLLRDVQALTLYRGRYTAARRTSPVPQLQCVGGSAGCGSFTPEVVQCQNKGWDGVDVQWECKADMDNWYRFGRVEVSCEGFNSPDDPYVLQGVVWSGVHSGAHSGGPAEPRVPRLVRVRRSFSRLHLLWTQLWFCGRVHQTPRRGDRIYPPVWVRRRWILVWHGHWWTAGISVRKSETSALYGPHRTPQLHRSFCSQNELRNTNRLRLWRDKEKISSPEIQTVPLRPQLIVCS